MIKSPLGLIAHQLAPRISTISSYSSRQHLEIIHHPLMKYSYYRGNWTCWFLLMNRALVTNGNGGKWGVAPAPGVLRCSKFIALTRNCYNKISEMRLTDKGKIRNYII